MRNLHLIEDFLVLQLLGELKLNFEASQWEDRWDAIVVGIWDLL